MGRKLLSLFIIFILVSLVYPFLSPRPFIPCANSISCTESLTLKIENNSLGVFNGKKISPPKITISARDTRPSVLGAQTAPGDKHIYVDLANQTLSAYQGQRLFMKTFISSGKWGRTPKGDFRIWVKLRATRMTGGSGADYYDLPNVPYVMFFSNNEISGSAGFSLHGTYWHNNFGHPMSHGCVNMRITDAQKLYDWVNPLTTSPATYASSKDQGTHITIFGDPPT